MTAHALSQAIRAPAVRSQLRKRTGGTALTSNRT